MGVPLSIETVKGLKQALEDVVKQNHTSEEEKSRRLSICESCEHKKGAKCNLCGCFINYKAGLANSECPLGKWSTLVSETSVHSTSQEEAAE